ncbi:MAG: hypothetical protein ACKD6M_00035 [Candidatus Bathyarchaeota archaeon]
MCKAVYQFLGVKVGVILLVVCLKVFKDGLKFHKGLGSGGRGKLMKSVKTKSDGS